MGTRWVRGPGHPGDAFQILVSLTDPNVQAARAAGNSDPGSTRHVVRGRPASPDCLTHSGRAHPRVRAARLDANPSRDLIGAIIAAAGVVGLPVNLVRHPGVTAQPPASTGRPSGPSRRVRYPPRRKDKGGSRSHDDIIAAHQREVEFNRSPRQASRTPQATPVPAKPHRAPPSNLGCPHHQSQALVTAAGCPIASIHLNRWWPTQPPPGSSPCPSTSSSPPNTAPATPCLTQRR